MTWVRKQAPAQQEHTCQPPMRRPPGLDGWATLRGVPVGDVSDLWRCDTCRKLWRITKLPGGANVPLNRRWRPATWWQRLTHPDQGRWPSEADLRLEMEADRAKPRPPRSVPPPPFEPVWRGQQLAPGASPQLPERPRQAPPPPPPSSGNRAGADR